MNKLKTPDGYLISADKDLLQPEIICALLKQSYWADKRTRQTILKSLENSICFGVYKEGSQVGLARIVTDYATVWYLCDVIIDPAHRGHGLGKSLVAAIVADERFSDVPGMLLTKDAHGLYRQYGFREQEGRLMRRFPAEG